MTAVVGIRCKDGVVIGADSSATFVHGQERTIEQPTEKLFIIDGSIIVAGSGAIGFDQRFQEIVQEAWNKEIFRNNSPIGTGTVLSRVMIENMKQTFIAPGNYNALLAFPHKREMCLCEFDLVAFQPEMKTRRLWYCSIGSAQTITDSFLGFMREVFWQDRPPSVSEGLFAASWTLKHAIKVNPGGVNEPIRMAVLEPQQKGGSTARLLEESELQEHLQYVEEAMTFLREFRKAQLGQEGEVPAVPRP